MPSTLINITKARQNLRGQMLMRIHYLLEKNGEELNEGINLVDPRAEAGTWLLATVKLTKIETSGICHCQPYHGDKVTLNIEEFDTDSLFTLLTFLTNGK